VPPHDDAGFELDLVAAHKQRAQSTEDLQPDEGGRDDGGKRDHDCAREPRSVVEKIHRAAMFKPYDTSGRQTAMIRSVDAQVTVPQGMG